MKNLFEKGDEFLFQIGNKKSTSHLKIYKLNWGTWDWD